MKFLKSIFRVLILLIVAIISVFIFFKPEDLLNAEVVGELLKQDSLEFIHFHQKPNPPVGINQDWINYVVSIVYLFLAFDLFRKNSYTKKIVELLQQHEGFKKFHQIKGYKFFIPATFFMSLFIILTSLYSFFTYLPDILTYVEWTRSLRSKWGTTSHVQVWSSGWSLILSDFSTILCHAGILRMIISYRKKAQLNRSNF
jgi:hypothetical protein